MLDARLRKYVDRVFEPVGRRLAALGVSASQVTVVGFLLGTGAWGALAVESYGWALLLVVANRLADAVDGAVARTAGLTDLGGYLDITLDFIFYAGVPFFFAVGRPKVALPAAFLVFAFMTTGSAFLAYASVAARRGLTTEARGKKSLYYLGGVIEGTETIALFVVLCLVPSLFAPLAWGFGLLCLVTAAARVATAVTTLR